LPRGAAVDAEREDLHVEVEAAEPLFSTERQLDSQRTRPTTSLVASASLHGIQLTASELTVRTLRTLECGSPCLAEALQFSQGLTWTSNFETG
jgi:hypothetical protein